LSAWEIAPFPAEMIPDLANAVRKLHALASFWQKVVT